MDSSIIISLNVFLTFQSFSSFQNLTETFERKNFERRNMFCLFSFYPLQIYKYQSFVIESFR
jgi:hypothetical protein